MICSDSYERVYRIRSQQDLTMAVVDVQKSALLEGSSPVDRSRIATILSELGSNILKYARRGILRVKRIEAIDLVDIEILAEDRGPGIPDIKLALRDHYSTGGTLGLGLPGVQRMSDDFRVRSSPEGTSVICRKRIRGQIPRPTLTNDSIKKSPILKSAFPEPGDAFISHDWGCFVRPCAGYAMTGDRLVYLPSDEALLLAVIDATGHGQAAATIARSVETVIQEANSRNLSTLMMRIHERLSGTQGAAVGLLLISRLTGHYRYVGVGNTRIAKHGKQPWRGTSRDGVLGSRLPRLTLQEDKLEPGDLMMLWTDGLPDQESRSYVSTIAFRSAASIVRQWAMQLGKLHDDVGCGVLKWQV